MVQNFHLTIDWKKIYLLILLNFGVTIFGKVGGGGGGLRWACCFHLGLEITENLRNQMLKMG